MAKQIYIDSDGNEIQVSGTVNAADMLPIEAGSSTMTSQAIAANTTKLSKFELSVAKNVTFQTTDGCLLIYMYTDDAKQNGMRIDFDSRANVIELSEITNGTRVATNRITFTHV